MPAFFPESVELLKRHEGFRSKMYKCSEGYWTIGYGLNLEADGITQDEAEMILVNRMIKCLDDLETFPWWEKLTDRQKAAVLDWRYQMGAAGMRKFKRTLQYLDAGDFNQAGIEMLDSLWAKQTPNRANEISRMVRGLE